MHDLREVDVGERETEGSGLDARRVEDVADQRREPRRLVADQREKGLALFRGELAPPSLQCSSCADHGRHGTSQLVRDERDEVGPQRGEAPELLDGLALGVVRADVLHGGCDESSEQREELDFFRRE